jgi:hypothetical protein
MTELALHLVHAVHRADPAATLSAEVGRTGGVHPVGWVKVPRSTSSAHIE